MKVVFFLIFSVFIFSSFSFAQVQLDVKEDTTTQKQSKSEKKSENKAKNQNNQKNIANKNKNKSSVKKKPAKKPTKRDKYVFKKEEQNVYKFDERGNPIIKQPIKKATETKKSSDFAIGIENKDLKIKGK